MVSNCACASPARKQHGQHVPLGVEKALERRHAVGHGGVRRRREGGIARPGAADPVLRAAKLAGSFIAAPSVQHQHLVYLADQAIRQRKTFLQAIQAVIERRHVVRDFAHVVKRNPGRFHQLEAQKIRQRRLRALDLRGKHRFLAYVGVQKKRIVRQERRNAVEAAQSKYRRFQRLLQRSVQNQGGLRRQRRRHKGANALTADACLFIAAAFSALHDGQSLFTVSQ